VEFVPGDEPCSLFDSSVVGDFGRGRFLDVGAMSLSGAEELVMAYDDFAEGYSIPMNAGDLWDGLGTAVTISTVGTNRMGAMNVEITSPENLSMVAVTGGLLDREATTFTWAPGNGHVITVQLRVNNKSVACISEDDGEIQIPAAAFAWLGAEAREAGVRVSRMMTVVAESLEPMGAVNVVLERRWVPDANSGTIGFAQ
jgi:hypothetical protein